MEQIDNNANDAVDIRDKDSLLERSVVMLGRMSVFFQRHLNYFRLHMLYFIVMCIFGGLLLWISETGRIGYTDALSTMTSAMCVTGLSVVDTYSLSVISQFIIMLWILLGSTVFMSVVPLFIRLRYFKKTLHESPDLAVPSELKGKELDPEAVLTGHARLEYLSIKELIKVVLSYYAVCMGLGFICFLIYFAASDYGRTVLDSRDINTVWFSLFHAISSFNNAGYVLISDNLVQFSQSVPVLVITSFLILLGNTAFPIALYAIVWVLSRIKKNSDVYKYILKNPRKVFTHLFQFRQTMWLVLVLLALNITEAVIFVAMDWNRAILGGMSAGDKVLNGYFTAISTRTAGFNTVDLSIASPAVLIIQVGFMYVSSYPVALSVRYSGIKMQKEKKKKNKLYKKFSRTTSPPSQRKGINGADADSVLTRRTTTSDSFDDRTPSDMEAGGQDRHSDTDPNDFNIKVTDITQPDPKFVGAARNIVARDILWLFIVWVVIGIIEEDLLSLPGQFPIFKSLFEVVSAYGTVGLTLGTGTSSPVAFCGLWHNGAKVVLCIAMILGRHRGLPESIDRAVQLPNLAKKNVAPVQQENAPDLAKSTDSASVVSLDSQSSLEMKNIHEEDDLIIS